jgi:hypothetical protein
MRVFKKRPLRPKLEFPMTNNRKTQSTPLEAEDKSLFSDPEIRERFLSSRREWEEAGKSASDDIRASETLTERDFAVRINTR